MRLNSLVWCPVYFDLISGQPIKWVYLILLLLNYFYSLFFKFI